MATEWGFDFGQIVHDASSIDKTFIRFDIRVRLGVCLDIDTCIFMHMANVMYPIWTTVGVVSPVIPLWDEGIAIACSLHYMAGRDGIEDSIVFLQSYLGQGYRFYFFEGCSRILYNFN